MTNESAPAARLNGYLAAVRIAHEAIYDLSGSVVAGSTEQALARRLLAESARITLTEVPALTMAARRLAEAWHEQSVLDADAAAGTQGRLAEELDRIAPQLRRRIHRQREIARELQQLVEGAGER